MPLVVKVVRESGEAIYEQIAQQIRAGIGSGSLTPGAQLPSVRALASQLGINLNTAARAAFPSTTIKEGTTQYLQLQLRAVLQRMRQAGLPPEDIRDLAMEEIGRLVHPPGLKL